LSPAELQNLVNMAQNLQTEGQSYQLPEDIHRELETVTSKDRKTINGKFAKSIAKYDGDTWTKGGATNKQLVAELKRSHVDANQLVQQMYKDAEKVRLTARAATELFEDIGTILEEDDPTTAMQQLLKMRQKCQALAVYGFSTSKQLDNDAKSLPSIPSSSPPQCDTSMKQKRKIRTWHFQPKTWNDYTVNDSKNDSCNRQQIDEVDMEMEMDLENKHSGVEDNLLVSNNAINNNNKNLFLGNPANTNHTNSPTT
ncbi:hypothetical protein BCR42DRAFT_476443, partial [Absidia repens]